jgi:hypothetical protein
LMLGCRANIFFRWRDTTVSTTVHLIRGKRSEAIESGIPIWYYGDPIRQPRIFYLFE